MVNNYDAVLLALSAFIAANAPAGAEREVARMQANLAEGRATDYIGLEFRPTQDTGAQLYVKVESPEGRYDTKRIMDEEGNRWYAYVVRCEVSWASWGSGDVVTCQRRLAVMTEVNRFACEVERAFSMVFHRLDATAMEISVEKDRAVKTRAIEACKQAVLANCKGMKVGDRKSAVVGMDISQVVGELIVERYEGGRHFTYSAMVEAALTGERGLVCFMRLEA